MRPVRAALAVLVLTTGCTHTPPTPDAPEVDKLDLEGTQKVDEDELKKKLVTGESSWLPWWVPVFGHTAWFDPSAWQADLRRVTRFYEANGYYQARVLEDQVTPIREGHVKLSVKVREGEPTLIASLGITGLELLTTEQRSTVLKDLPLQVRDVFVEEKWAEAKRLMAARLRELGYATAVVEGEALVDVETARVEVTLNAVTGTRFHFGKVFVATDPGAEIPPRLVADVATPDVKQGDWFSESALLEAQTRVFQMGVFSGVKVNRGAPDVESATVPVIIDVREAPFKSARIGFGLGGELTRQEVRLTGEYTNRNLGLARLFFPDARLDRLTVKGKVGWTFLWDFSSSTPTLKTGPTALVLTEYEVPRVFNVRTLSFQGALELSRQFDAAFDFFGGELKAGVIWRPRTDLTVFPSLNFDAYLVNSAVSVRDAVPPATLGCPQGAPCLISFLDVSTEFDHRDARLEPREGYYLRLSVQGGVASTTSLKPYLRVIPEARGYLSFGTEKRVTLAGKLRAGTLISTDDDTPVVARFFSGGSSSGSTMRGFNSRRLSPQLAVPRLVAEPTCEGTPVPGTKGKPDLCDGETLPVGGNGLVEASVELRWNVWGDLVLVLFNDWGLVTRAPLGPKTDFARQLYAAVGLGARYRTPVGPIRLDFGVRLPFIGQPLELELGEVRAFKSNPGCFSGLLGAPTTAQATALPYGGSPDSLCTINISIGEAF